ncbi:MAG: iron ABC transporter ATP-binding protein [Galactobacter sp.]
MSTSARLDETGEHTADTHAIELEGVLRSYTDDVRIGPVDLRIPAGGMTALVGPNGAGKSTLLTMIGRLMGADAGTISVGGHDVAKTPSKQMAKVVSILRQENHFVTRLTVRQLVGFGRFPYSKGHLTLLDEDKVSEAIDFMGLSELETRYLDQLSGGQRQRAYVAMVLAQDTDYILLDEPLNNLDMEHSAAMMRRLDTFVKEQGKTVVIVLHDINFAARYASHICAMKNGQVAHFGTAEEVMDSAILTDVFNTQVDVLQTERGPIAVYY